MPNNETPSTPQTFHQSTSTPILSSQPSNPSLPKSTSGKDLRSPSQNSPLPNYVHYQNYTPTHPKNFHPYMIHSTSSSLLTRSNSSPTQPLDQIGRHRPSRSMSSLAGASGMSYQGISASENESGGDISGKDEKDNRRRSYEVSTGNSVNRVAGIKRSGTLPSFPSPSSQSTPSRDEKEVDLPVNPKLWTPSELATYLGWMLRTGGTDGQGQILPAPVVEDIKSWVLRHQVSGRGFLKGGGEGWGNSSKPPPFFPLLQSISRRLRRSALQGKIPTNSRDPNLPHTNVAGDGSPISRGSVLMEEDELLSEDDELTGVKRMANAFEGKGSASEASGDESGAVDRLRPQWTGESNSGGNGARWGMALKRTDTGGSHNGRATYGMGRPRRESGLSVGGLADEEGSPRMGKKELADTSVGNDGEVIADVTDDRIHDVRGKQLSIPTVLAGSSSGNEASPPPPYTSPNPIEPSPTRSPRLTSGHSAGVVLEQLTITPSRLTTLASPSSGLGIVSPSIVTDNDQTPSRNSIQGSHDDSPGSPHMANMENHQSSGFNPYAALRRSSSSKSSTGSQRLPTLASLRQAQIQHAESNSPSRSRPDGISPEGMPNESSDDEKYLTTSKAGVLWNGDAEIDGSRLATARRVTMRPSRASAVFDPPLPHSPNSLGLNSSDRQSSSAHSTPNSGKNSLRRRDQSRRERELEIQMGSLVERIKELEERLLNVENVSTISNEPPRSVTPLDAEDSSKIANRPTSPVLAMFPDSILVPLGLGGFDDEPLPRRIRELPGYLFLVGVGVGAVMVRVLFKVGR